MGLGVLEAVQEEEVCTLEEARRSLTELRERNKAQSLLLVAWKRRLKHQNMAQLQLQRERDHELRKIQSQLLLYESQMRQRNKEVSVILREKDATIRLQREIILYFCKCFKANLNTSKTPDTPDQNPNEKKDLSEKGLSGIKNNQVSGKGNGECKLVFENGISGSEDIQNKDNIVSSLISSIAKGDQENLNDSDSAIMLEDNYDSFVFIPQGKGEVKVVRSVSDAVEAASRSTSTSTIPTTPGEAITPPTSVSSKLKPNFSSGTGPGSLSTSPSCSSEESDDSPVCTLTKGRKELIRTVYSLEEEISHAQEQDQQDHDSLLEDTVSLQVSIVPSVTPSLHSILKTTSHYDSDATLSEGDSDDDDDDEDSVRDLVDSCSDRRKLLGSYEKLNTLVAPVKPKPEEEIQVTYNRVMSNHRSVTKPKDVKYRRINKAKSRSLEELRGKLKYWTDRGGKQSLSVDLNTDSYA